MTVLLRTSLRSKEKSKIDIVYTVSTQLCYIENLRLKILYRKTFSIDYVDYVIDDKKR